MLWARPQGLVSIRVRRSMRVSENYEHLLVYGMMNYEATTMPEPCYQVPNLLKPLKNLQFDLQSTKLSTVGLHKGGGAFGKDVALHRRNSSRRITTQTYPLGPIHCKTYFCCELPLKFLVEPRSRIGPTGTAWDSIRARLTRKL